MKIKSKIKSTLSNYQRDIETQAFIIKISLDNYEEVFDDWDPSPFKMRDIEDEFLDFLWDSVEDIPSRETIIFEFSLPTDKKNTLKEQQLVSALHHQYNYMLSKNQRNRRRENKEALKYLLLGFLFFLIAYLGILDYANLAYRILNDGLFVGAWVFVWEAFSNVFIESRDLRDEKRIIKRFIHAEVRYFYR